jgi:hypothetical protein
MMDPDSGGQFIPDPDLDILIAIVKNILSNRHENIEYGIIKLFKILNFCSEIL